MKPIFNEVGDSYIMGEELRKLIEENLKDDLAIYGIQNKDLKFDWSESCQEGHSTFHLDGRLESFSNIGVFSSNETPIAEGWMEFITDADGNFIVAYWEFLTEFINNKPNEVKSRVGIPEHIWHKLPENIQAYWKSFKLTQKRII